MPMPRKVNCTRCGGHVSDVGRLSARKVCQACGEAALVDAIVQLREKRGEVFDRWQRNLVLAVLNLNGGRSPSLGLMSDADLARLASPADADALR